MAGLVVALASGAIAPGAIPTATAAAQDTTAKAGPSEADLARKLTNPISDLVSIPFQFNWENEVGPTNDGMRMVLNIQPVVPFALTKSVNLIERWIMPYVAQPENLGSATGFGDVTFSSFVSPAGPSTVVWGVGPVLTLPLSTDPTLGSGKWAAGPTAVVLKLAGAWTFGALANQVWSFANASSAERDAVSAAFVQPFVAYVTRRGVTYSLQSETSVNWKAATDDDKWTVPINVQISKLTKLGPLPFSVQAGAGVYVKKPAGGPDWKLRTAFVVLLPRGK